MPRRSDHPPAAGPQALAAGQRAIANTLYRSGGEVVGRLASLALFAEAGRSLGQNGLGAFVFAIAYLGLVMVAVDIGLDRFMLRALARERSSGNHLFFNVLGLKLALAVPLFALGFVVLKLLGYHHEAEATAWALAPGVFADSIARTQLSVFLAHERSGPSSVADTFKRVLSAALGIAALKAGYGVVSVAVTYSIGSILGVLVGFVLMARTVKVPSLTVTPGRWRGLALRSVPFAAQDTLSTLLARVDTLILSLLASQAAVGRYGAAYRLFESTTLISYSLTGAFAAMFTYLGPDTDPPLRAVFQRAVKLALVALIPIAVAFVVLAEPICTVIYGHHFDSAAGPLRILGSGVVFFGVVTLCTSLLLSRENPARMVSLTGVMAAVNVALNFLLIPLLNDSGAALAMLITEAIFAVWILRTSTRSVGRIRWPATATGGAVAGAAMVAATLALHGSLWLALGLGVLVYVLVLPLVERIVSPVDARLVAEMLRRRLPSRSAG